MELFLRVICHGPTRLSFSRPWSWAVLFVHNYLFCWIEFLMYVSIVRELFLTVPCEALCPLQVYGLWTVGVAMRLFVLYILYYSVIFMYLKAISRSSAISACCCAWTHATSLLRDFTSLTLRVDVIAFNSAARWRCALVPWWSLAS